ncbi:ParA family protein [Enterocloster sp.]|jgi:virC1 protein|uniref:ParA family protein n=1 Tax=Enterocloster sp. TaxID=2719315 RepID=UPI0029421562|nr:ParA family protein [uncultured Enterocloster sp.]
MRIISIINLKGGCGKTTTAAAMAEILVVRHGKRVILLDNDKQGNASRLYQRYNQNSRRGTLDMIHSRSIIGNIMETGIEGLSLIPCNYYMKQAEIEILMDSRTTQHDRYREALAQVEGEYDYCIIDNPPDIGMNVVNALSASQEVIIPINLDNYSLDGLEMLMEQVRSISRLNPNMEEVWGLVTDYERSATSESAEKWLREQPHFKVFSQHIRHSRKAKDATFYHRSVVAHSPRSGAALDYRRFVDEYLRRAGDGI